ncbi:hypothetical protein [Streptomyces sp. NPDC057552]|uniref:hypothetical protein n=1 Tax=Streptomyces sp. NPDC057552 TaxID=3350537 RepID=UPI00369F4365
MTAADMERLDVLVARAAEVAAANTAKQLAEARAENRHLLHDADSTDTAFAHLPCPHPELCSTDADYPGFDAWIAQQQTLNTRRGNR